MALRFSAFRSINRLAQRDSASAGPSADPRAGRGERRNIMTSVCDRWTPPGNKRCVIGVMLVTSPSLEVSAFHFKRNGQFGGRGGSPVFSVTKHSSLTGVGGGLDSTSASASTMHFITCRRTQCTEEMTNNLAFNWIWHIPITWRF